MPARSLPNAPQAPLLLLVLAITTGWMDAYSGRQRVPDAPAVRGSVAGAASADHRLREGAESFGRAAAGRASGSGFSSVISRQERGPELVVAPERALKVANVHTASQLAEVSKSAPSRPRYSGENRFWIPSLGISRRVRPFACSRQRPPGNHVYRWGCAGNNNVYIMGHAYSVMKPLHDAYVRGKLKVGMVAIYANANGKLTRYRVTEWRVVDPVDSHWAIADQATPSMTLQTCVGKDGRYRLSVRLVALD